MKNKAKAPAFQFYAAEYLADASVQLMTLEEEGAYIRLLAYCWREGSIPADENSLSRLCKGASPAVISTVKTRFTPVRNDSSKLVHLRLEKTRAANTAWRKKCELAGKKSGEARRKSRVKQPEGPLSVSSDLVELNGNSSSSSSSSNIESHLGTGADKAESSRPILPTLDQAMERAPACGVDPKAAEVWWLECESRGMSPSGHFIDAKGHEIRNWASAMTAFGRKWQSNDRRNISVNRKPAKVVEEAPKFHLAPDASKSIQEMFEEGRARRAREEAIAAGEEPR